MAFQWAELDATVAITRVSKEYPCDRRKERYPFTQHRFILVESMGIIMKQYRIDMEDKPGALAGLCDALADAGVNILDISAYAWDKDVGHGDVLKSLWHRKSTVIIRTDDPDATSSVLDGNYRYSEEEVMTIELEHRSGSLASFAREIGDSGVNITSLHVMSIDDGKATIGYTTE